MRRVARDANARLSQCVRLHTTRVGGVAGRFRCTDRPICAQEPTKRSARSTPSPNTFGWAVSSFQTARGIRTTSRARLAAVPATDETAEDAEEDDKRPSSQYDFANKPSRGINQWKRSRKKAAWIKANATVHRENKTARSTEREMARLEKWRLIASTQRAWNASKKLEASVLQSSNEETK
jgi:hypothetical protein